MTVVGETFSELLVRRAELTPDAKYVLFEDEWLTFGAVAHGSERVAAGLQRLGVGRGDRVALILPNCPQYVLAYFACSRLGAIMVPLNTYLRGTFLHHQLADSQASVVISDELGFAQIRAVLGELPELREIVVVADQLPVGPAPTLRLTLFDDLAAETAPADLPAVSPDEISGILYTSGTTGMPKGCLITHRYCVEIVRAMAVGGGFFTANDRLITSWPIFHVGGYINGLGTPLVVGGSLVLEAEFSASAIIDRARATDATVLYGMGAMALAILAQPPRADDRNNKLRFAFLMPLKPEIQDVFKERFGLDDLCSECYGQTECVPVSISAAGSERKRESAGRPLPHFQIRIADDDDNPVPVGDTGEILVRPNRPGVMYVGYWNNPDASLNAIRNLWHHTGDYGRLDDEGYLHFVDRKKDAIRRRGEFVSSMELEQALLRHPDIAAVAVHPVPSAMTDDDIKAWIVPREGHRIDPQNLFDYCRKVLPYYALPRYVEISKDLPVNAALRVLKHELKKRPNTDLTWDLEHMGLVIARSERRT